MDEELWELGDYWFPVSKHTSKLGGGSDDLRAMPDVCQASALCQALDPSSNDRGRF